MTKPEKSTYSLIVIRLPRRADHLTHVFKEADKAIVVDSLLINVVLNAVRGNLLPDKHPDERIIDFALADLHPS